MRFFVDTISGAGLQGDDEVKYKVTNGYIEVEYAVDEVYLVVYLIPRSESSIFVTACWDRTIDELLENVGDMETVFDTWPKLGQLMVNGLEDRYSEGALIKLEDPDTGEPKWFVASVAGNLDLTDPADFFSERSQRAMRLVTEKSMELFAHLNENRPSILRSIGRGIAQGLGLALLGGIAGVFGAELSDEY